MNGSARQEDLPLMQRIRTKRSLTTRELSYEDIGNVADLLLHRRPQSRYRLIPLVRNSCEVVFRVRNLAGADGETALPASTTPADDIRVQQHPQVLGNRLACQIETVGEFGNRIILTVAEAR